MVNTIEQEEELEKTQILCMRPKEIDIPILESELILRFNYLSYREQKNTNLFSVQTANSIEQKYKTEISESLATFINENKELALNERYSDSYFYKVSSFYKLLGDWQKEGEYLDKIIDRENNFYKEQIAENQLRKNEDSKKNLLTLFQLNTVSSIVKLSGYYMAEKDFLAAQNALDHFIAEHEDIPFEIYCQYALLFIEQNDFKKAIHFERMAFYNSNKHSECALILSVLYLASSKKNANLLKKSKYWCKIACILDCTNISALTLLKEIVLEDEPDFAQRQYKRFLATKNCEQNDYYFDAQIFLGKCYFVKREYNACIQVMQTLVTNSKEPSAVWNNIALCSEETQNLDRAERNIKKALDKYKEQVQSENNFDKNEKKLEIIHTNYMRILNKQKKWSETIKLFEQWNGNERFILSEKSYANYFFHYFRALIGLQKTDEYFERVSEIFYSCEEKDKTKLFACNDIIRFCTLYGCDDEKTKKTVKECIAFLISYYADNKKNLSTQERQSILNNIVFASIEADLNIDKELFKSFTSSISNNPFSTATYGLYQFRIMNNFERGKLYYQKAIELAKSCTDINVSPTEFELKAKFEEVRELVLKGNKREAERLVQNMEKKAFGNIKAYALRAKKLLNC